MIVNAIALILHLRGREADFWQDNKSTNSTLNLLWMLFNYDLVFYIFIVFVRV